MTHALKRLMRTALDAVFPPTCLACAAPTAAHAALCATCWRRAEFLHPRRVCDGCGAPLEARALLAATGDFTGILCDFCAHDPIFPGRIRAAMLYHGPGRAIVLRLKYADALHSAPTLARWMARAGADVLADADGVVPIPLHWGRHWGRRYNQAAELSRALAAYANRSHCPDALRRIRGGSTQEGKARAARQANVAGAFEANPTARGLRFVLVDDVVTTGATLAAAADALLSAGAKAVDAVTLARVAQRDFAPQDNP